MLAKAIDEFLAFAFFEKKFPVIVIRFNTVGPLNDKYGMVIQIYKTALNNQPITVFRMANRQDVFLMKDIVDGMINLIIEDAYRQVLI